MQLFLILLLLQMWREVSSSQKETCSGLPDLPHASVTEGTKKTEYQEGDVIHFICEIGYISGPTIRYVCNAGYWSAIHQGQCYLKPCELPDDTPNGYYQLIHGEDFVFGSTIKYFCNEGYQMISREDTRACLLNNWTNHVPICEPRSCDVPPADGGVTVKGIPENDDPIIPDRFLTFSCDDPATYLKGSSLVVCGKNGQWDKPFPSCEEVSCEVGPMHRQLSVTGLPPPNEMMKFGHRLWFKCNNHFTLEGYGEIECVKNGEWNKPFPTCTGRCIITAVPVSVHITQYVPTNYLRKGQWLRFACRWQRYILQGTSNVQCLEDGHWSDPFPICKVPTGCGPPPPLADGDTKLSLRTSYQHGDQVEYICQRVYTIAGEPFKTCINGKWIGQMRCLKPCTVDINIMREHNIAFRLSLESKLYAPHDDLMEFMCVGLTRRHGALSFLQRCVDGVMYLPTCL